MAPTDALSAPGAVSYSSDTLVVGDGTWDFTKNTFLLPNLVGLPFDTMQYNGEKAPPQILKYWRPAWAANNHRKAWEIGSQL